MSITIKDIAREANVSIATVSHIVNRTRYVSPELVKKVEEIIKRTGYNVKLSDREYRIRVGKLSEIAFVIPNIDSTVYGQLATELSHQLINEGFFISVYLTNDSDLDEKHILSGLMSNKRIAGIILVPTAKDARKYSKLISSGIPLICLERMIENNETTCVLSENLEAIYKATSYLIKSGHQRIGILIDERDLSTTIERLEGYKKAISENRIEYSDNLVIRVNRFNGEQLDIFDRFNKNDMPTALIATGNYLTLMLLKSMDYKGLECPKDVSIIGFGDDEWCNIISPPLTTLKQNIKSMALMSEDILLKKVRNEAIKENITRIPMSLIKRKSIQVICRGPLGEKATNPDQLLLTDQEITVLKKGEYKVGISFHYSGTEWTRLHEAAIRETLNKYGIMVVSVMDAHFDPDLQVTQLEGLKMQKPDAIISIPIDEQKTAQKFKDISKEIKLIFISNIPQGFQNSDYYSCISVNERENGKNAAKILGDYFQNRSNAKIGLINHGLPHFITRQRDFSVEQVLTEDYPNIEIVSQKNFYSIENAYNTCKDMICEHPDIEGLYVSWERPALEVIKALKEMGRSDISISTIDLDTEIASHLAKGEIVIGISAQRPYEQGIAVALATANALLGKRDYKYISVDPCLVEPRNLNRAWKEILHAPLPDFLNNQG